MVPGGERSSTRLRTTEIYESRSEARSACVGPSPRGGGSDQSAAVGACKAFVRGVRAFYAKRAGRRRDARAKPEGVTAGLDSLEPSIGQTESASDLSSGCRLA